MSSYAFASPILTICSYNQRQFVQALQSGYHQLTGKVPSSSQIHAWNNSWPQLHDLFKLLISNSPLLGHVWAVFEYRLPMEHELVDLILLGCSKTGDPIAIIVELKGWNQTSQAPYNMVQTPSGFFQHPEVQVSNYEAKLSHTHSAANQFKFHSLVWLYNLSPCTLNFQIKRAFFDGQLSDLVQHLNCHLAKGLPQSQVNAFLNGQYQQSNKLLLAIHNNLNNLQQASMLALAAKGFAPSQEQHKLFADIMSELGQLWNSPAQPKKTAFLVQGAPGSGKSYVAVLLLLKALAQAPQSRPASSQRNVAVLGYRNNRLINTLRMSLGAAASTTIKFFDTGQSSNPGLAQVAVPSPDFDLVIYDEAQRLLDPQLDPSQIDNAFKRGCIVVFFYDEGQILNPAEGGTLVNFQNSAQKLGYQVICYHLSGTCRVLAGQRYHDFVEDLLNDPPPFPPKQKLKFQNYQCTTYNNINVMMNDLKALAKNGNQVALVAAYTESPGDRGNQTAKSLKNRRVGFPLYSGFNHYQGSPVDIYWLMDPKHQYPLFWYGSGSPASGNLTHCASVYGCQGFEADYVGVIWGRDMIWNGTNWDLGPNCEDNYMLKVQQGKGPSLKSLFNSNTGKQKALSLLRNRYRILLTRGIKGTLIYCEDQNTAQYLAKWV